ncbi:MAG: RNA polymerase sigma factor [Candidatus Shapirobacteria bacterium]
MPPPEIEVLLEQHFFRLRAYLGRRISDFEVREEILQETLAAAQQSFPGFAGRSSFFTWLCAIANHEAADYYRKQKIKIILFSRFPWLEQLAEEALGPEQKLLRKELSLRVTHALARLNEGYRHVLRLKYYQGLSVAQIAAQLHVSYKTIESRLSRARLALAKVYSPDSR